MKPLPRTEPFIVSKTDIVKIKNLIDTTNIQTISRQLHIPYKEVMRIATELKLI